MLLFERFFLIFVAVRLRAPLHELLLRHGGAYNSLEGHLKMALGYLTLTEQLLQSPHATVMTLRGAIEAAYLWEVVGQVCRILHPGYPGCSTLSL